MSRPGTVTRSQSRFGETGTSHDPLRERQFARREGEALVNTVNTVGVMGKGIALMFKEAFPDSFREYAEATKEGRVRVGRMFVTRS